MHLGDLITGASLTMLSDSAVIRSTLLFGLDAAVVGRVGAVLCVCVLKVALYIPTGE